MRIFIALIVACAATAKHSHGHHHHLARKLSRVQEVETVLPARIIDTAGVTDKTPTKEVPTKDANKDELETVLPAETINTAEVTTKVSNVQLDSTSDVPTSTAAATSAATAANGQSTTAGAVTQSKQNTEEKLRKTVSTMSNRIQHLEQQLKMARAHPVHPVPPPLLNFLRGFDKRHFHHIPPASVVINGQAHKPQRGWRHWRQHHAQHHHHVMLAFGITVLVMYALFCCVRRCCCSDDNGTNEYPAYSNTASSYTRGLRNPYVGVSSSVVVPTAEGQPLPAVVPTAEVPAVVPTAEGQVVPSAPIAMAVGVPVGNQQLQHGVVLGTPVNFA